MAESQINYSLPYIDINLIKSRFNISKEEREIIEGIVYNPLNGVGILRATRPKQSGAHSWVWRNVMMMVSPEEKFHVVTPSLDGYLAGSDYDEQTLNGLVDKIISTIPENKLLGILDWKDALGA